VIVDRIALFVSVLFMSVLFMSVLFVSLLFVSLLFVSIDEGRVELSTTLWLSHNPLAGPSIGKPIIRISYRLGALPSRWLFVVL
jgi:hypothetical protein